MEYNLLEFVKDFSYRTIQNKFVVDEIYEKHCIEPDTKVYEVTQLINSLFGIIIVPYEKYKRFLVFKKEKEILLENNYKVIKEFIDDLQSKNLVKSTYCNDEFYTYPKGISVFKFVKHLRNALAHSGNGRLNFFPISNGKNEIEGVFFIDMEEKSKEFFCCELSIEDIKKLYNLIPALFITVDKYIDDNMRNEQFEKYKSDIKLLKGFLNGDDLSKVYNAFT